MKIKQDENGNWFFDPEIVEPKYASCEKCGALMCVVSGDTIWSYSNSTGRWEHDCEEARKRQEKWEKSAKDRRSQQYLELQKEFENEEKRNWEEFFSMAGKVDECFTTKNHKGCCS